MCVNFQEKRTTLTFSTQICPKRKLGFEIHKTNVGIRIIILEILWVPIFRQNGELWIFRPQFTQKWILGSEFQKSKSGFGISTSDKPCVPVFSQNGQFLIFWPKFGEIAQLRTVFWFKHCWGCCRELGGGGWSWVNGLVITDVHFHKTFQSTVYLWHVYTERSQSKTQFKDSRRTSISCHKHSQKY